MAYLKCRVCHATKNIDPTRETDGKILRDIIPGCPICHANMFRVEEEEKNE